MKAAGHELNGLKGYYRFITQKKVKSLHIGLMCLIDYRGFRVSATSRLPLKKNSLKYGSNNGGATVHADSRALNQIMEEAGKFLWMKPHLVGADPNDQKLLSAPCDIEAHLGSDGRFYVLDTARCTPPETPSSNFMALSIPIEDEKGK